MAVKIRMRQQGRKNRQTFRLVVTDIRNPRDGKYVETLGSYDPHRKEKNLTVNAERLKHWLGCGAILSEKAEQLVKTVAPEVIQELQQKRVLTREKNAKARRKKKVAKAPAKKEELGAAESAPKAAAPKKTRAPAVKKKAKVQDES